MAEFLKAVHEAWRTRAQPVWPPWGKRRSSQKKVLFYRDFLGFTGGHLKVWDYFNHVRHSAHHQPCIAFSSNTVWNDTNPWLAMRGQTLAAWSAQQADILFLGGMDWSVLSEAQRRTPPKPVFNLIQHGRHADPNEPLYQYLSYRAIRICVSAPVADALTATGRVNGPLFTIRNGIDLAALPPPQSWETRRLDLLIVGIKQPALATEIHERLKTSGHRVQALTRPLARADFLELLGNARIALLLPNPTEGFYLPALESFALETLVICPDCVGNRRFCLPGQNCLQPPYTLEALLHAVRDAVQLIPPARHTLLEAARHTARQHSLLEERRSFLDILQQTEAIWRG